VRHVTVLKFKLLSGLSVFLEGHWPKVAEAHRQQRKGLIKFSLEMLGS
jgi:hypothetical protein